MYVIFLDRENAMPLMELLDYIVYAASIKITAVPELIGCFGDTSAVAIGIMVEEYIRQVLSKPSTFIVFCSALFRRRALSSKTGQACGEKADHDPTDRVQQG